MSDRPASAPAAPQVAAPQAESRHAAVRPVACRDMAEVRREIDRVDRAIVALLAERRGYIEQAGRIKTERGAVRDEARITEVLARVRTQAQATGADPDLLESLYRQLVEWSIAYELTVFDARR